MSAKVRVESLCSAGSSPHTAVSSGAIRRSASSPATAAMPTSAADPSTRIGSAQLRSCIISATPAATAPKPRAKPPEVPGPTKSSSAPPINAVSATKRTVSPSASRLLQYRTPSAKSAKAHSHAPARASVSVGSCVPRIAIDSAAIVIDSASAVARRTASDTSQTRHCAARLHPSASFAATGTESPSAPIAAARCTPRSWPNHAAVHCSGG